MTARGFACIGLHMPKTPENVGSVLRAAGCFGASMVAATGRRYRNAATDTMKAVRHLPLLQPKDLFDAMPYGCIPVAVDLVPGAVPLDQYQHPERAFYIFGPEDGTLGASILDRCRDKVMIPTAGCLNLAATVNVILYDRAAKRGEWAGAVPRVDAEMNLSKGEDSIDWVRANALIPREYKEGVAWLNINTLKNVLSAYPGVYKRIKAVHVPESEGGFIKNIDGLSGEFIVFKDVAAFRRVRDNSGEYAA